MISKFKTKQFVNCVKAEIYNLEIVFLRYVFFLIFKTISNVLYIIYNLYLYFILKDIHYFTTCIMYDLNVQKHFEETKTN